MSSDITVIVVNYNAGQTLLRCLEALQRQTRPHDVLVIDNASTDGSTRAAFHAYPHVRFVPLRRNVGFCRAVNLAATKIAGDGVMVTLNPDVTVAEDFLGELVEPLEYNPRLASTAGTLVFSRAPEIVASAGIRVHRNGVALDCRLGQRVLSTAEPEPVFGASGGAAAYRTSTFRAIGGFADPLFLYLEDADLSWRLRLQGWETLWAPRAVGRHDYSAAAVEGSPLKRRLLARNRIWTLARCLPQSLWLRDRRHILAFDLLAVGYASVKRDVAAIRGRAEGIAGLPLRLHERTAIQATMSVATEELGAWLLPPVSACELLRLRALTAKLAGGNA